MTVIGIQQIARLLILLLCCGLLCAQQVVGQTPTASPGKIIAPRNKGLLDLVLPDLERFEPAVRDQIVNTQTALLPLTRDSRTGDRQLGEAYAKLGMIYQAYALNAFAVPCYTNAQRLLPDDFRWVYLLGTLSQQENRPAEAIAFFQQALKLRPNYLAAIVNLGNIYLQDNQPELARAQFTAALAVDGNNAAAKYGLGQLALSARHYREAISYFEEALKQVPAANRLHYGLAMAYRGLGERDQAEAHLRQQGVIGVRVADPLLDEVQEWREGERLHLQRGKIAFEARRFAEAAEAFRKALRANPASVPARVNLGSALAQLGDLSGAIAQFEAVLRDQPQNPVAHYNLGFLLAQQNQPEPAIAHLQIIVDANPNDSAARLLLARQLARTERRDAAIKEYAAVLAINPDNEEALLEQVNLLLQAKMYREALAALTAAQTQFPKNGGTAITLAYLLAAGPVYELRDGKRALELAQRVYQATSSVNQGAVLALALAELGRCKEAADWQRRLIALAEAQHLSDLAAKLKNGLLHYEQAAGCRPAAESVEPSKQP